MIQNEITEKKLLYLLFYHYFNKVSEENWGSLFSALQHSKEILESNIENEKGQSSIEECPFLSAKLINKNIVC